MAKPTKHYGGWRIRWFDSAGVRRSAVYEKRQDAQDALKREEAAAVEGRPGPAGPAPSEAPAKRTFDELADRWIKHRVPEKRSGKDDVSMIRCHLRPAFGALPLTEIRVETADAFKEAWPATLGGKTLNNVLTLLVSMLNYALELDWLEKRPRIRKRKLVEMESFAYLRTREEIGRFLRAARQDGEPTYVLYASAIYTGMRAGELAGLLWGDVDMGARRITVRHSYDGPTKAGYVRHVPILDPLLPVLSEWKLRGMPGANVFTSNAGNPLLPSARIFQEIFQRVHAAASAGVSPLVPMTFHDLRHTFASHWVMNGGDLFKLRKICGWKSDAMVNRYAHLSPDAFTADYSRLRGVEFERDNVVSIAKGAGS